MEIEFLYQGEVSLNILWRIFSLFLLFIFHSTFSRRSGIVWRNVAAFKLRKVNLWKKGRPMYRVHIVPSTEVLHEFKCFLETRRKFLLLSKKGETALNLGGSRGGGEEETPLIRPISKNIPIVHDETRFRSLTFFFLFFFFFSIPLLLDIFPKIPFINSKNQASQNFTNLYLRINRKI